MIHILSSPFRNLVVGTLFTLAVSLVAVLAYVGQGWSPGDAVYMVVLTIYTVGFDEVRPIDTMALRAITITLIVTGCTGMIFLTGSLIQLITISQFAEVFGVRRMQRDIDRLSGHVIVCGYGRIGQSLAVDLKDGARDFVLVDRGEERLAAARALGFLTLFGDATDEDVLRKAGVMRARALATVLPDDAANVFIPLSARSLNASLTIIARGEIPATERKLLQAGADRVVLPAHIGAERIAEILMFKGIDHLQRDGGGTLEAELGRYGLDIEIVAAAEGSPAAGASVADIERLASGAFMVMAIERRAGPTVAQPSPSMVVEIGDGVAVLGRPGPGRRHEIDLLPAVVLSTARHAAPCGSAGPAWTEVAAKCDRC